MVFGEKTDDVNQTAIFLFLHIGSPPKWSGHYRFTDAYFFLTIFDKYFLVGNMNHIQEYLICLGNYA